MRSVLRWDGTTQPLPGQETALPEWKAFSNDLVREWAKPKKIDMDELEEPILPLDTDFFLIQTYITCNRLFFHNKLPPPRSNANGTAEEDQPGIKIEWSNDLGPKTLGLINGDVNGQPIRIRILRRKPTQHCLTGADAIAAISHLLHEMCHAYELANFCWCHDCEINGPPSIKRGRTGHGNHFHFLGWLVERAANHAFGAIGSFDLKSKSGLIMEQKARRKVWRKTIEHGLPYEPMITPGGKVIVPQ
ncbi:MAG: hypothetical protein Q9170_002416 [Blastenia crenularia]